MKVVTIVNQKCKCPYPYSFPTFSKPNVYLSFWKRVVTCLSINNMLQEHVYIVSFLTESCTATSNSKKINNKRGNPMGFETCWWLLLLFTIKSKYTETGLQSSLINTEAEASVLWKKQKSLWFWKVVWSLNMHCHIAE
jgi:hypothetical protein